MPKARDLISKMPPAVSKLLQPPKKKGRKEPSVEVEQNTDWMTPDEKRRFADILKKGLISRFRVGECGACGAPVPKPKKWCSLEHKKAEANE